MQILLEYFRFVWIFTKTKFVTKILSKERLSIFIHVTIYFTDTAFAAKTTGLEEQLIKRFRVILIALNSSEQVDGSKFHKYAMETAAYYKSKYDWYCMPVSVHKVLFHGAKIIDYFDLPIGNFSEEAQEKRNKDFKRIRENNSRKNSRQNSNEDIMHWLLISSSTTRIPFFSFSKLWVICSINTHWLEGLGFFNIKSNERS